MPAVDLAHIVRGAGPPVYFAHGIGSRKEAWLPLMEAMANRFTCIAYDQRGHGKALVRRFPIRWTSLSPTLKRFEHTWGHEAIHVVGHSLGGQIGPAYALAHPERCLSVGALSTAAFRTEEDSAKVKGVVAAIRRDGAAKILPTLVDRWFTEDFAATNPDVIKARLKQVLDTPEDVFTSVFDIYASTEMAGWLDRVGCPVLVLTAEHDGGCNPRLNRQIADALPDAELVIMPDLKHSILLEAPLKVAEHVAEFLTRRFG